MSKSSKKRPYPNKANEAAPVAGKPMSVSAAQLTAKPSARVTTTALPTLINEDNNEFTLIRFDKRAKWYLGICVGLFLTLTLLKIHTLSLAVWNQLLPDGSDSRRGLIAGTPRQIRMDDYAVAIPWHLSSANQGFPKVNEVVGGEEIGLLMFPTHSVLMLFKPIFWGSLLLDSERAISWMFNFNYFALLVGAFLFFMLVTKNNFWLSVLGSLWLWLSSGTQNWNSGPAVIIAFFAIIFVCAAYLLFSEKFSWRWFLYGSLFCWALFTEALYLYPAYQVPIGYTFLLLFLGYVINNSHEKRLLHQLPAKIGVGLLCLVAIGAIFYSAYIELRPTLEAVTSTVYPGKRSEVGGTGFIANWFSEYYSWLVNPQKYPQSWLNICELSHYLTFVPVIAPCLLVYFSITRKIDWMLGLLVIWVIVMLSFMEFAWPKWLAEATLLSMSPTRRLQIPLGVSSVILTVIYLGFMKDKYRSVSSITNIGLVSMIVLFMLYTAYINLNDAGGLFKAYQMFAPVLFFAFLNSLLLFTIKSRYKQTIFSASIIVFLLPNLGFNPLSVGLSPITDHALYRAVKDIDKNDPDARWVVFGSQYISYMVTATGVKLISGVKFVPPRNIYKVLDPKMKHDSVYNRYSHTVYQSYITGTDSIVMQNPFEDGVMVAMDPCSPKLKTLNVKYIIFDKQPQPVEIRCMKLVSTLGSIQIYRVNE